MAVIYKISCLDETIKETYVGSTLKFKQRIKRHEINCHYENGDVYNYPLYKFIRENGGWEAWEMKIIDSLTTTNKNEMLKFERRYIAEQKFSLNKQLPTRTVKKYYLDHKEKIIEYKKEWSRQWYEANKEAICKRNNEKVQCERCGAFSSRGNLRQHKKSKKCMNAN